MYWLAQKLLFNLDAEVSHDLTLNFLKRAQNTPLENLYKQDVDAKPTQFLGMTLPNPVGLAAGLDKNGECIDAFAAMGFGFIEVGTVTPLPQAGNDKPRLFRLKDAQAIVNRMGFNNKGVDYLVEQVKQSQYRGVLGINIGKNKVTPEENALDDYLICMRKVYEHASYITINISSPNTPGLRNLQYGEALEALLSGIKQEQQVLADRHGKHVPVLVKIAPDLSAEEIEGIADSLKKSQVEGVIATNTTISRDGVEGLRWAKEAGGLSGGPLTQKSLEVTRLLANALAGEIPIMGVGGIDSAQSAQDRLDAGAQVLQVYSSFIYQGPQLITDIVSGIQVAH
ncbi:quinone-dependent dihydroorotate dehydrogenase [Planctobacterium marinum]|uniref:quinone-dependent dihydroorotate dehydrogenase n=1 Tax=Planctobacterium marinum TaxID=1631968 RepID=UPI001E2A7176|nr:quinone-dependent dihydroorotate dehydrogenase [Planctobacterium marinum]MCC2604363.1 quinone-dependent dihydroorotate dehydrogenase [Planctobacterium marinum]